MSLLSCIRWVIGLAASQNLEKHSHCLVAIFDKRRRFLVM
jgi:hypothetical protein